MGQLQHEMARHMNCLSLLALLAYPSSSREHCSSHVEKARMRRNMHILLLLYLVPKNPGESYERKGAHLPQIHTASRALPYLCNFTSVHVRTVRSRLESSSPGLLRQGAASRIEATAS